MSDVRHKVVCHPSSWRQEPSDESTPPPQPYTARLCRALIMVALGTALHLAGPAGPPLPVPAVAPSRFAPATVAAFEPAIVLQRSFVFAPAAAELAPAAPATHADPMTPAATIVAANDRPSDRVAAPVADLPTLPDAELIPTAAVATGPLLSQPSLARLTAEAAPIPAIVTTPPASSVPDGASDRLVTPRSVGREVRLSSSGAASEEELVQRLIEDFTGAYGRLDVSATKAVWPTVDGKALKRAFDQLSSQRLTLQSCGIKISGSTANARCRGSATYQPRIGTRSVQVASREWTFDLSKQDAAWRIVNTFVR